MSAADLIAVSRSLSERLAPLSFGPPVTHVYDPLTYAREPHERYLERYGDGSPEVVLVGMNPGPWGMAQTGVPFGEISLVRDWLGIEGEVGQPAEPHPKRPIEGFDCPRSEVSGRRLWGWACERFGSPEAFFARFFVANYCPLTFMEESGRNRTPDKLPAAEREPLFTACNEALGRVVEVLRPRWLIGIGGFAEQRARAAVAGGGPDVRVGRILHPSPASPAANRGWSAQAEEQLAALGIELGLPL